MSIRTKVTPLVKSSDKGDKTANDCHSHHQYHEQVYLVLRWSSQHQAWEWEVVAEYQGWAVGTEMVGGIEVSPSVKLSAKTISGPLPQLISSQFALFSVSCLFSAWGTVMRSCRRGGCKALERRFESVRNTLENVRINSSRK